MEIMLESLMVSERREYLYEEGVAGDKCNGYCPPGRTYGHGRTLTSHIPYDCYGNFYPRIWSSSVSRKKDMNDWLGPCIPKV